MRSPCKLTEFMTIGRVLAWTAILAIVLVSVVPAAERPVTGLGQVFEHFIAFGIVASLFALVYPLRFWPLLLLALLFCGGIELLQIPLPTRHARISDFVIDVVAAWMAICVVAIARKLVSIKGV
jgi:VanZ family protein